VSLFGVDVGVDTVTLGGTGAVLLTLMGYLFKELRRKDEGVWAIIADRDKQIDALTEDRDYWRNRALGVSPERRSHHRHRLEEE
jgi:hypothetical protein